MNGRKFGKGCGGAVWSSGYVSSDYCTNTGRANGKYPWYARCCYMAYHRLGEKCNKRTTWFNNGK